MNTYIATIGRFKHDDFRMSCWAVNPELTSDYVIKDDNSTQATFRAVKYCEELTEKSNKYAQENNIQYNKHEDEVKYRLISVYNINHLTEIK